MADVQLDYGYLQIANALFEAIAFAGFSGTQTKIMLVLVRLTYGWRRRSVRASHQVLASRCGFATATGGFRRELDALIREGVVLELECARGRQSALYAINKDFEKWRHYSVPADKLIALYDERPESDDRRANLPQEGQSTGAFLMPQVRQSTSIDGAQGGQSTVRRVPQVGTVTASGEAELLPQVGTFTGSNSNENGQLGPPKDIERQEIHNSNRETATVTDYAVGLVVAANNTITEKWSEQPNPLTHGSAVQLAADLIGQAIPLPLAQQAIAASIRKSRQPEPPKSIEYFRPVVIAAWRADEQRRLNGSTPTGLRGGHLAMIGAVLGQPSKSAETREVEWQRERRDAAIAWGKDPANESAYRAIAAAAKVRLHDFADTTWGEKAIASEVIEQCAAAVAFPTFLDWRKSRDEPA